MRGKWVKRIGKYLRIVSCFLETIVKNILDFWGEGMEKGKGLTGDYRENVALIDGELRVNESFDMIKKVLSVGEDELTLYYIDGLCLYMGLTRKNLI